MGLQILRRLGIALLFVVGPSAFAAPAGAPRIARLPGEFPPGSVRQPADLPMGRFRSHLEQLPASARLRSLEILAGFHFTELDLRTLEVDAEGGVFYADAFALPEAPASTESAPPAAAAVPVDPWPAGLVFHSRPGAPNVLFLNFAGETVTGTAWNTSLGRTSIPAVSFSTDTDFTMFSDAEQTAIKRIWQRVAEDYAPFDLDVTTERPATLDSRTAEALITRNTDADGADNPSASAGGVAYVNVFGSSGYASHRPAWIYFNNLANNESYIAEAASHEVGHNFGLSHDGQTDGTEYYPGHGSGEISWGPIMGTGYNRNVSQWSRGEYYLANNTQDDLATIAAKAPYRPDLEGDTAATAVALVLTGGTNIVATTPETDPANLQPANKGVIESSADVDVFSFVTGNGPISLTVNPWIEPSGTTRGGNLDVLLELRDAQGALVTSQNATNRTAAQIQVTLPEGLYFLHVRGTGTGDPLATTPTGYTSYASVGQYFISGFVTASAFVAAPLAELQAIDLTVPGAGQEPLTVTYADRVAIDLATLDDGDLRVTGPNGYDRSARFVRANLSTNGTPCLATYAANPPDGSAWQLADNGAYEVWMQPDQVRNSQGVAVTAARLGQFHVSVPACIYIADLDVDPGWTLQPRWEYGAPAYPGVGPTGGFTGTRILAYNLSGNYEDRLSTRYATTTPIDCSGFTNLTLQFRRWLRVRSGDTATVEVSTDGSSWSSLWSAGGAVNDSSWQLVQYPLPASADESPALQIRWGMGSGPSQNDIGWNLDDIRIFAGGRATPASNTVLTVTVNEPAWGTVSPPGGTYAVGTAVSLDAAPATYYRFVGWSGDLVGTNNPGSITMNSDRAVHAEFGEILTAGHGTPWWWLAGFGWTNDFETAELQSGANGVPLWQSYIAGLDPADPSSQLRLQVTAGTAPEYAVLNWTAVSGRVYTLWQSTNLAGAFAPVDGATDLPAAIHTITNTITSPAGHSFYRLEVRKP